MPRLIRDFPVASSGLTGTYSIDFAGNVPPGTTITAAAWMLGLHYVLPGAYSDPAPQSRIVGAAGISSTVTTQTISGLLVGNDYLVTALVTLSDGETTDLWTVLPCRAPA